MSYDHDFALHGLERLFGSNPENALLGLLAMAFMVTYMIAAPLFGYAAGNHASGVAWFPA